MLSDFCYSDFERMLYTTFVASPQNGLLVLPRLKQQHHLFTSSWLQHCLFNNASIAPPIHSILLCTINPAHFPLFLPLAPFALLPQCRHCFSVSYPQVSLFRCSVLEENSQPSSRLKSSLSYKVYDIFNVHKRNCISFFILQYIVY